MTRTQAFLLSFLSIVCLLFSVPSQSTTMLALDLKTISQASDEICTGTVIDKTSFLKDSRIFTLNRIKITQGIKGASIKGLIVEVITAGGRSELFSQKVFGAAELEENQTYLLFLEKRGTPNVMHPVGMTQGALPVVIDTAKQTASVHPPKSLPRLLSPNTEAGTYHSASFWLNQARDLNNVITEIHKIVGTSR